MLNRIIPMMFLITYLPVVYAETGPKAAVKGATQPVVPQASESLASVMFSLVLVVSIIFLIAWSMRRMGGKVFKTNSSIKILSGISMGSREKVVLVQVGKEQLLLGVAPGRVQTLHVLQQPVETDSVDVDQDASFSSRLKSMLNK